MTFSLPNNTKHGTKTEKPTGKIGADYDRSRQARRQILEKAIQKAIDGGWNEAEFWLKHPELLELNRHRIIFNHDFAKALWGEDTFIDGKLVKIGLPKVDGSKTVWRGWQYHLQQMVIADDTIKYLGENI